MRRFGAHSADGRRTACGRKGLKNSNGVILQPVVHQYVGNGEIRSYSWSDSRASGLSLVYRSILVSRVCVAIPCLSAFQHWLDTSLSFRSSNNWLNNI